MAVFLLKESVMNKIYIFALFCALCAVFYFYGMNVGKSKCEIKNVQQQINQVKTNKQQERIINEKVYKTGVDDIRRILHNEYTIKQ